MHTIDISTNIGCRNACRYCAQEISVKAYKTRSNAFMMDFSTFKTCLDKIPADARVNFAGRSECWLNPDCTRMMLYAHERGYRIAVLTTLVGMKSEDAGLIEKIPFLDFLIHLPTNERYQNIKVDEDYLKVLDSISNSAIKCNYMIVAGTVHDKVKALLKSKIAALARKNIPLCEAMNLANNVKAKVRPVYRRLGVLRCEYELNLNTLYPNGDVSICCMDFGMKHVLGNLVVSDYESILHSEEFYRVEKGLKDASLNTLCRYCDMAHHVDLVAKICNPLISYSKEFRDLESMRHLAKRIACRVFHLKNNARA